MAAAEDSGRFPSLILIYIIVSSVKAVCENLGLEEKSLVGVKFILILYLKLFSILVKLNPLFFHVIMYVCMLLQISLLC